MSVIISPSLVLLADANLVGDPLRYCHILYKNKGISASGSTNSSSAVNVLTETTYDFWSPSDLPANLFVELTGGEFIEIDAFGVAGHNFGTIQASVAVDYWNGSVWVNFGVLLPANNNPILFLTTPVFTNRIRFQIISSNGLEAARIAVVKVGSALKMQRKIYGGHSPITLSRTTDKRNYLSDRGEYLGSAITRSGVKSNYSFNNLTAGWYRENFDPFVVHMRTGTCFIAWKPADYPNEVAYGWNDSDIIPTNSGTRDFMSVSFEIMGYVSDYS